MFTNIYRCFLVLNETGNSAACFMNLLKYLHHTSTIPPPPPIKYIHHASTIPPPQPIRCFVSLNVFIYFIIFYITPIYKHTDVQNFPKNNLKLTTSKFRFQCHVH